MRVQTSQQTAQTSSSTVPDSTKDAKIKRGTTTGKSKSTSSSSTAKDETKTSTSAVTTSKLPNLLRKPSSEKSKFLTTQNTKLARTKTPASTSVSTSPGDRSATRVSASPIDRYSNSAGRGRHASILVDPPLPRSANELRHSKVSSKHKKGLGAVLMHLHDIINRTPSPGFMPASPPVLDSEGDLLAAPQLEDSSSSGIGICEEGVQTLLSLDMSSYSTASVTTVGEGSILDGREVLHPSSSIDAVLCSRENTLFTYDEFCRNIDALVLQAKESQEASTTSEETTHFKNSSPDKNVVKREAAVCSNEQDGERVSLEGFRIPLLVPKTALETEPASSESRLAATAYLRRQISSYCQTSSKGSISSPASTEADLRNGKKDPPQSLHSSHSSAVSFNISESAEVSPHKATPEYTFQHCYSHKMNKIPTRSSQGFDSGSLNTSTPAQYLSTFSEAAKRASVEVLAEHVDTRDICDGRPDSSEGLNDSGADEPARWSEVGDEVPEGFLATKGSELSVSFSMAPQNVTTPDDPRTEGSPNMATSLSPQREPKLPVITSVDIASFGGTVYAVIGDELGRIELLEGGETNSTLDCNCTTAGGQPRNPSLGSTVSAADVSESHPATELRSQADTSNTRDKASGARSGVGGFVSPTGSEHLSLSFNGNTPLQLKRRCAHQAFVEEFDCLKSISVDQQIRCMKVLPVNNSADVVSYLAANERTIKLFRIRTGTKWEGDMASRGILSSGSWSGGASLSAARGVGNASVVGVQKRIIMPVKAFTNVHEFRIQTLSLSADNQTFLSADDFQVYWWDLNAKDTTQATLLADVKTEDDEEITTLLTTASFHPIHGSLFLVADSNGVCSVGDLRDPMSRSRRQYALSFAINPEEHNTIRNSEHNDILSAITAAQFFNNDFIVTRDYMSLKLWDMRRPTAPSSGCPVMSYVAPCIDSLYECDYIFDRFPLAVDDASLSVVTGLYDSTVAVWRPGRGGKTVQEEVQFLKADRTDQLSQSDDEASDDYSGEHLGDDSHHSGYRRGIEKPSQHTGFRTYVDDMKKATMVRDSSEDSNPPPMTHAYSTNKMESGIENCARETPEEDGEQQNSVIYPRLKERSHENRVTNVCISKGGHCISFVTKNHLHMFTTQDA